MKTIKIFEKELVGTSKGIILSDTKDNILIIVDNKEKKTKAEKVEIINFLLKKSSEYWRNNNYEKR